MEDDTHDVNFNDDEMPDFDENPDENGPEEVDDSDAEIEEEAAAKEDNVIDLAETLRKAMVAKKAEIDLLDAEAIAADADDSLSKNEKIKKRGDRIKKKARLLKELSILERKVQRVSAAPEEPSEDDKKAALAAMVAFVEKYKVSHVGANNEWWIYDYGEWHPLSVSAFYQRYNWLAEDDAMGLFHAVVEQRGQKLNRLHYSWIDKPGYLNLLDAGNFCPVVEEEGYHFVFDLLMRSLGGDKPENVDHLERVLLSKYLYPQNYLLPVLVFSDRGTTGKSLLVSVLCVTMFGGAQNIGDNLAWESIAGKFNGPLAGKIVVFANEKPDTGDDENAGLKRIAHSKVIQVERKGKDPIPCDATFLLIIAANPKHGATIKLAYNDTDRRFSVIEATNPLPWYIAEHLALSHDNKEAAGDAWMRETGQHILGNQREVGKWLYHLIQKHGDVQHVKALHGGDYAKQKDAAADIIARVCEEVFKATDDQGKPTFDYIRGDVLFELARSNGSKFGKINFHNAIKVWLADNGFAIGNGTDGIAATDIAYVVKQAWKETPASGYGTPPDPVRKQARVYVKGGPRPTVLAANDARYGICDGVSGRWTWHIDVV